MAQKRGGGNVGKINQTQDTLIKNLMIRCKNNGEKSNEDAWQMPEMVGYYNDSSSLPVAPVQSADEAQHLPVKKVVCSPDLPIAEYPAPGSRPPLSSATATAALAPQEPQVNIQCQICHKMYTSKAAYQTHQRTHTRSDAGEDPYRCNICSKTFAVPARLTRHYRTHTGEKPFCCEFCHKSFSVKENLSVHRRIHTKERPYKCEVCSRAFEHSGKLHRHMRIHTGERPHKCTVCSKTFIQSGQLVIHMRTHTGEKPYVCNVCQKGFTCSKQLKVHSRTHTGEKPYSCEICGKSFGYNHVLKLHQVAHYGEKVYKCTICKQDFNSKKSMEAHIKNHNETPPSAPTPPASSCSSISSGSTSDQDNKMDVAESPIPQEVSGYESEFRYYIYPRSPQYVPQGYGSAGVELLAAAASATERNSDVVFNIITKNSMPQEVVTLRHPAYFTAPSQYHPVASEDIRRRVEAAVEAMAVHHNMPKEEDPILTPPSSNPVSPAPSVSPVPEHQHSLPPRKRSKMILKSMEASIDLSPVRLSSVIQYARASS